MKVFLIESKLNATLISNETAMLTHPHYQLYDLCLAAAAAAVKASRENAVSINIELHPLPLIPFQFGVGSVG